MGTVRMTVKAIDWTEGDVGKIHVKLNRGSCRIDWGDGKSTSLFTYTEDWVSANHQYPSRCKVSGEMYEITISSLEDNITGFRVSSGDMMVADVDLSDCQSLEYIYSSWLIERLNITTNLVSRRLMSAVMQQIWLIFHRALDWRDSHVDSIKGKP